jgi:hypothetical protein
MRGFKSFAAVERFCRGYDELRNFLYPERATTSTSLPTVVAYFTFVVPAMHSQCSKPHRPNSSLTSCRQVWREC